MFGAKLDDSKAAAALRRLPAEMQAALLHTVQLDVAALWERAQALASGEALRDVTGSYLHAIKRAVKWSTSRVTATIEVDDRRAGLFEYGGTTRPHTEEARGGGVMAFAGPDAGTLFRQTVHHPGADFPAVNDAGKHATIRRAMAEMAHKVASDISHAPDQIAQEL